MSTDLLPPFINSTGLISKIFAKIQEAQEPDRYTQDFQGTVLGYGSGSAKPFIPFLKRLGFLEADGRPTEIYKKFRNADTAGAAMAEGIRRGYANLFKRNEYCYKLSGDKLKNLVVEVTGKEKSAATVRAIVSSFQACNSLANFDNTFKSEEIRDDVTMDEPDFDQRKRAEPSLPVRTRNVSGVSMAFGYNINLNLPNTDDPKVFNAIFKALRENLLGD